MAYWKEPLDAERHRDYVSGAQDAGGRIINPSSSDGWVYFVRAGAFTFAFANLEQLREAIRYFGQSLHPARRRPGIHLEHYWQRWFERLPPGLIAGTKRVRVRRALLAAFVSFADAKARSECAASRRHGPVAASEFEGKRVALAGVLPPRSSPDAIVAELKHYVATKGGTVHAVALQRRGVSRARVPGGAAAARRAVALSSATFLGAGKATELAGVCHAQAIDVVFFLNPISSSQRERLQAITGCNVVVAQRSIIAQADPRESDR
ncbi:MAG: hypothetical protein QM756_36365 [Polyangiaceae bacterium]